MLYEVITRCKFDGVLYEVVDGVSTSVSAMAAGGEGLVSFDAHIEMELDVREVDAVTFPFPLLPGTLRKSSRICGPGSLKT